MGWKLHPEPRRTRWVPVGHSWTRGSRAMPRCHFSSVPSLKNKIKSQNPFVAFLSLSLSLSPSFFSCLCHSLSLSLSLFHFEISLLHNIFLSINQSSPPRLSLSLRERKCSSSWFSSLPLISSQIRISSTCSGPEPLNTDPVSSIRSDPIHPYRSRTTSLVRP